MMRCPHQLIGDVSATFDRALPIDEADERSITFCNKHGSVGEQMLEATRARLVITGREHEAIARGAAGRTFVLVDEPRMAFARVLDAFFRPEWPAGVDPTSVIGDGSAIGQGVHVGRFCAVGRNVVIGDGSRLEGSVTIYDNVRIGRNVVVRAGAVIGTDGFGYSRNPEGKLEKFPQIGGVEIGDDVEIGSNACVARGALSCTRIGRGTKIDNLVHIAHNVHIGEDCVIIAHAQIAGSVRIGDRCWLAPSCTITNGITIGDDAMVALGSVVVKDVKAGEFVAGNPARPTIRK